MDVKKLCHICSRIATQTCKLCGRPVCEKHMGKRGICVSCARGLS